MELIITKVQSEKDGQTLFLKNDKGEEYRTVISIANGNFVKVNEGDKISLEVKKILSEMDPPVIISKEIQIIK